MHDGGALVRARHRDMPVGSYQKGQSSLKRTVSSCGMELLACDGASRFPPLSPRRKLRLGVASCDHTSHKC